MTRFLIKIVSICLLVLPLSVIGQTAKTVSLKGTLKNFSNQVEVSDMSDMQYLLPPTSERMIIPDEKGNFSIQFDVVSPNYFSIGRNALYLSPGDDLEVVIDYKDPIAGSFKGKGSAAALYLRRIGYPKGGSFIEAGRNIFPEPQKTVDKILEMASSRKNELKELKGVTPEFKRLERARIKADILNSYKSGESYARYKISKDSLEDYISAYKKITEPLIKDSQKDFADASLMKIVVYRDIANQLLDVPGKAKDINQIKDWFTSYKLVRTMQSISDKEKLKTFTPGIDSIVTAKYRTAVKASLENLLKFGKGDIASDFTAVDLNGNKVTLSSLKGKVIYVDLWATWCGPCLAEMPHYETLKEKYKTNPAIAFVSLSIDDGAELWKNNVAKRNADGIQWQINRNKLDAYNIVGIPRMLLFDKDFKVVDMNAPTPSAKELPAIIDNLLK
ncbi:MAG: TlpA disulfide reductase family protein [Chitinophagaceae bacterium]